MTVSPDAPLPASTRRIREHNATFGFFGRLVMPILKLQARYEVHGAEKLPATGPFILTPNHYSNFDPVAVGVVVFNLKRVPRWLAKASLWKVPFLGWVMRSTGQVPVDRTGRTRDSDPIKAAAAALSRGEGVIIYPEGSLTREPGVWPMRGKTGAVRLALETGVPLIPLATWGVQQIMPVGSKTVSFFPRKHLRFAFGDPVDLSAYRGRHLEATEIAEATELVMARITDLLAPLRGETPPTERYDPVKHNQTEFGRFVEGTP